MPPLFAEDSNMGQAIGITALISTIATGLLALIGTYLSNRQAAKNKADDRDNDDKWKMIGELQKEVVSIKLEYAEYREESQQRHDNLARDHSRCQAEAARLDERVAFLEDWLENQGLRVPRKRPTPEVGTDAHKPLPPHGDDK